MLVLTRGLSESIIISSNITVTLLDIRGTQVRLGIAAPQEITIDREEVHYRKIKENTHEV